MVVGLSKPSSSGLASDTSLKLGEERELPAPVAFELSSCSVGLASASFHSPVSVSREIFQEFVAAGKLTATERIFSTLKKSLLSHWSGFGSTLPSASKMRSTSLESLPTLTKRPSGQPPLSSSSISPAGEGRLDFFMCFLPSSNERSGLSLLSLKSTTKALLVVAPGTRFKRANSVCPTVSLWTILRSPNLINRSLICEKLAG